MFFGFIFGPNFRWLYWGHPRFRVIFTHLCHLYFVIKIWALMRALGSTGQNFAPQSTQVFHQFLWPLLLLGITGVAQIRAGNYVVIPCLFTESHWGGVQWWSKPRSVVVSCLLSPERNIEYYWAMIVAHDPGKFCVVIPCLFTLPQRCGSWSQSKAKAQQPEFTGKFSHGVRPH